MAGPIRISVLADASAATKSVQDFTGTLDGGVTRAARGLGDATKRVGEGSREMADGFDRATEGADRAEQRAMGFRDTITGVQDSMSGAAMIAKGDLAGGLLTLGMGVGDLASGFANLLIPLAGNARAMFANGVASARAAAASVAHRVATAAGAVVTGTMTAAQWALNVALSANPIGLVILAIIAMVVAIVVLWKRSETFRRIVTGAFTAVWGAIKAVWGWVKRNWPGLQAAITRPITAAVSWVRQKFDSIVTKVRSIKDRIVGAFSNANTLLRDAGRRIVEGLWNGITGLAGWLSSKVRSFITSTVPGPIARALGIASPSRVARQLGRFTGMGLGLGLDDERTRVQRAAATLAGAAVPVPAGGSSAAAGGRVAGRADVVTLRAGDTLTQAFIDALKADIRKRGRGSAETYFRLA